MSSCLFYFATRLHFTSRHNDCQAAVVILGTQNHTFADDTFQLARSKVGDEANLLAYQLFRLVMLGNARYDGTCFQSVVNLELQQFIRFRHFLTFEDGTYTDIQFREILEFDVRTDRISSYRAAFVPALR